MKRKRKTKSTAGKRANTRRVTLISHRAKKIRKKNEPWIKAIQRATKELDREGKI